MTRVLLIGGPGSLTRTVAERLRESGDVESCDVVEAKAAASLAVPAGAAFDVAVYLGVAVGRRGLAPLPERAEADLRVVGACGAKVVVVVSSAAVFPPRNPHPGMVDEARPPLRGANEAADGWMALEAAAKKVEAPPRAGACAYSCTDA